MTLTPTVPLDDPRGPTRRLLLQTPIALGLFGLSPAAFPQVTVDGGKPQRGGTLQISLQSDPPNFDPLSNTTGRVISVLGPCCNGLVRFSEFDPDKVVPDLAESWALSADGLAYTFVLRKGLKFHDGKPCTSADVKYTFDVVRDPPKGIVSVRANLLDAVSAIEAPDPLTVRFVLKRKSPSLVANLASGWMLVLPKHLLEKGPMNDQIVGTGPFKLKEYKRGVSLEFVRNPRLPRAGAALPGRHQDVHRAGRQHRVQLFPHRPARRVDGAAGDRERAREGPGESRLPAVQPDDLVGCPLLQCAGEALRRRAGAPGPSIWPSAAKSR
jgi:ABC-type transport system substrate-binding protein